MNLSNKHYLIKYMISYTEYIKYQNVKYKTIKHIEDNIWEILYNLGYGDNI